MRKIDDLEKNALKFWTVELAEAEKKSSIIPKLIETQDKFISILNAADASPIAWKEVLKQSSLPGNLFLKHLNVLADIGGEQLMRFKRELPSVFKKNQLNFRWNERDYAYTFKTLNGKLNWNNKNLKVDGERLQNAEELSDLMEDVCMLILFGDAELKANIPNTIEEKCMIGSLIGKNEELEQFVKQRYIWVSRITGGATANTLGHLVQRHVMNYLKKKLPKWNFNQESLPNVTQNERTALAVDIVAKSPKGKFCGIEVSFQVTTNSTIERKAGQARARQDLMHRHGHSIAYVIDGAGNFARQSALKTICRYSDCTVTMHDKELKKLASFLKKIDK